MKYRLVVKIKSINKSQDFCHVIKIFCVLPSVAPPSLNFKKAAVSSSVSLTSLSRVFFFHQNNIFWTEEFSFIIDFGSFYIFKKTTVFVKSVEQPKAFLKNAFCKNQSIKHHSFYYVTIPAYTVDIFTQ